MPVPDVILALSRPDPRRIAGDDSDIHQCRCARSRGQKLVVRANVEVEESNQSGGVVTGRIGNLTGLGGDVRRFREEERPSLILRPRDKGRPQCLQFRLQGRPCRRFIGGLWKRARIDCGRR